MLGAQFESPYGVAGPPTRFTIPFMRHMHEYGTTEAQLASVAVATRRWAEKNPRAMMREPITVDDVLNSRIIAYPFHLLECCLVTDGGGALVVVSAERAKDFPKKPVYVLGTGESSEHSMISQMHDFTESRAFKVSGASAFAEAGIERKDIDHAMFYDAFAHTPMLALEALGFVGKGESGPFFEDMRTAPGGDFPLNTNGGGLSYTHTGMYGMFAIQESVRQLRGEAAAQLPAVRTSIAHGVGGMFHAAGTLILTNDERA
jgi:acetyl-CoA acetyltransferase